MIGLNKAQLELSFESIHFEGQTFEDRFSRKRNNALGLIFIHQGCRLPIYAKAQDFHEFRPYLKRGFGRTPLCQKAGLTFFFGLDSIAMAGGESWLCNV